MTEKGTLTISFDKGLEGNPRLYEEYAKFIKVVRDLESSKEAEEKVFVAPVRDEQADAMIGVLGNSVCSVLGQTSEENKKLIRDGLWSCYCITKKLAFEQRSIFEMTGDPFIISHTIKLTLLISRLPQMFLMNKITSCPSSEYIEKKEEYCDIESEEEEVEDSSLISLARKLGDQVTEKRFPIVTEETTYIEKESEVEPPTQFQDQGLPPDALLFANNLFAQFGPMMSGLAAMQRTQQQ